MDNPIDKYSFSRLDSFHNCKRSYYNSYILGDRGADNIYSFFGTIAHDLTQRMMKGELTNAEAVEELLDDFDSMEMLGLSFPSEQIENNYKECLTHFMENYKPSKFDFHIEDYIEIEIGGTLVRGYVDAWWEDGGYIYVEDLKTSTKFSAKDLPKKSMQLVLYGRALNEKYGKPIKLRFNMLKYVTNHRGTLIDRNKIKPSDEIVLDGFVDVVYNDDMVASLEKYVKETVSQINDLDPDSIWDWKMSKDPKTDFFCINLCTHREKCLERG